MIDKNDLNNVKKSIENNIGQRVRLTAKKGRKKLLIRQGVIENSYPSIFVIKLDNKYNSLCSVDRRVTFSYTDILTKTVELVVYKPETDNLRYC